MVTFEQIIRMSYFYHISYKKNILRYFIVNLLNYRKQLIGLPIFIN